MVNSWLSAGWPRSIGAVSAYTSASSSACGAQRLRVVREDLPCRPCGRDGCGGGKLSECLSLIAPARVLAALDELLQETGR